MNDSGILLFAMEGLFSRVIFEAMLEMGVHFNGIVLPGRSSITDQAITDNSLNVLNTTSIESMARHLKIPIYYVSGKDNSEYELAVNKSSPDIVIVACFPFLLPAIVFSYPSNGAYNIHPSLLPAYRGPVPLFWQFYYGDKKAGITIHEIDATFDTGKIVLQETVVLDDGLNSAEATLLLATAAINQLRILLEQLLTSRPVCNSQNESQSSYYSWPGLEQFNLSTDWNVRRAFNFIRGTMHWKQAYKLRVNGKELMIREALEFSYDNSMTLHFNESQNERLIPFQDGSLRVLL